MPEQPRKPKRPRDLALLAKMIVDIATEGEPAEVPSEKNPHAVAMGKLGGRKGGLARAKKLSAEERKESARKAAKARWEKKPK